MNAYALMGAVRDMRTPPHLMMVIGTPGTGKTTLSKALAIELGCPRVEKDYISDPLASRGLTLPEHRSMTYEIIDRFAEGMLAECGQVLIEAPLKRYLREWRETAEHPLEIYARMARAAGGILSVVHAGCSPEIVHARILKRDHRRDDSKIESEASFARFLEVEPIALDPTTVMGYDVLDVDTGRPDALTHIITWLGMRCMPVQEMAA